MSGKLNPPPGLQVDDIATLFLQGVIKRTNIANQADGTASTVSVTSADASDLATAITLANELKADLNQLVTDFNALVTAYNALLAAMQTAETMDS